MDASRKPSIATKVHASNERPHRLALLATSPVATGEANIGESPQGDETHAPSQSATRKEQPHLLWLLFSYCSY